MCIKSKRVLSSTDTKTWVLGIWALIQYKVTSYQYRKSHCGDKTVVRSSYLHNGISYTGKISSLYWTSPQKATHSSECICGAHLRCDSKLCQLTHCLLLVSWRSSDRNTVKKVTDTQTDGPTDGQTDRQTEPSVELLVAAKNTCYVIACEKHFINP